MSRYVEVIMPVERREEMTVRRARYYAILMMPAGNRSYS